MSEATDTLNYRELACAEVWGGNGAIRRRVVLPGLDGLVISQPCGGGRGGDVYYVSACSMGLLTRVYLADVAGHGEPVSEMSEWLHGILRARINRHDAAGIFGEVNRHVLKKGHYALTTAACFTYDATTGALNYCYAGHPPILRYRRAEGRWTPLDLARDGGVRNVAFGAAARVGYDIGETPLEPGDRLLLYSDGVTDTPDPDRRLFGTQGLLAWLADHDGATPAEIADGIVAVLCEYARRDVLDHDDVTVLVFEAAPLLTGSKLVHAVKSRYRRWRRKEQ